MTMLSSHRDAETVAATLNEAHATGRRVVVGGRAVRTYTSNSEPATVYQNGTLAVTVEGRTARVGVLYFKQGTEVTYALGTPPVTDAEHAAVEAFVAAVNSTPGHTARIVEA